MRVEVVALRGPRQFGSVPSLYSYAVPATLAQIIEPGHLVTIPFGERTLAGIVWGVDASDDLATGDGASAQEIPPAPPLRPLHALLLREPVLLPAQRALAEWLAEYYAAPLSAAVRLMLPPGLLRSVRTVLRLAGSGPVEGRGDVSAPGDEAVVLGLLRERGWLEVKAIRNALGARRARAAISALLDQGIVTLSAEIGEAYAQARRERRIRLAASPEMLATWQAEARRALEELAAASPVSAAASAPRAATTGSLHHPPTKRAERILRQLALLDVLARGSGVSGDQEPPDWRLEDLRRLTRATPSAVAELERAGLIAIHEAEVRHDPLAGRQIAPTAPLPLTPAQAAALRTILAEDAPAAPAHRVFLLHGITGSGKTEIYLQALAAVLARGQRGLVLVPEIALTPQATARFAGRFPGRVAVLHSGLTDAERLDTWRRIRAGECSVVVGSRSALFAPLDHLGLIVVDEEHEGAYKEERPPTYHAREAAVRLGALSGARVVLGSATPSVEAYWQATQGAYTLVELGERAPVRPHSALEVDTSNTLIAPGNGLPQVGIIDLRAELRAGNTSILSQALQRALAETLARGEQAILFLNRRGTASSVVCRECGYVVVCGKCDVAMTFHATERAMICHYCGKRAPAPATCPVCWSASIRYFGLGTERIEAAVKRQFPGTRVLRWDRDTARNRQAHEDLLRAFSERRADVLVGTQMIAKGLDLPDVTLVGVVSADIALYLPDFRASERAFQLLTQVAGRAGRGARPGRVLIQTFNPDHFCIQAAARHNYAEFLAAELQSRERFAYPPFRRFVKCTYEHPVRYTAQIESTALATQLERLIAAERLEDTDLVGPAPAFMERLRGRYRWQLIIRSPDPRPLLSALAQLPLPHGWSIDVDPASTL